MDRNTIIGLVLIAAIMVGYGILTKPSEEELQKIRLRQDSLAQLAQQTKKPEGLTPVVAPAVVPPIPNSPISSDTAVSSDSLAAENLRQLYGVFAPATKGEEKFFTLENELIKITLSSKGGKIKSVQLKKYDTFDSLPLYLFHGDSNVFSLNFFSQNRLIRTDSLYFEATGSSFAVKGSEKKTISLRLSANDNQFIEFSYTLSGNSYSLGFDCRMKGMEEAIAANTRYLNFDWQVALPRLEKNLDAERKVSTVYYRHFDEEVESISPSEEDVSVSVKTRLKWVAFKQQYFTSVLLAENGFESADMKSVTDKTSDKTVKTLAGSFTVPYQHKANETFPMKFYFGPTHYQTLKKLNIDLEKQVPLGWGIFGWVNKFLVIPVFNFLNGFSLSYGIVILLLTIIVKIVLLPLTFKAYLSAAKMKVLKPEIDVINAKKGDDPMKTQQELMALYRKAGVNPLGGCFPMLLQIPILFALINFFPSSIELRHQPFLWAHDLSTYDSILELGFKIPFYGDHISLFALLMTASTIVYTKLNSQLTAGGSVQMQQMKWMMYLMPVMFLFFLNNLSAALSYYYFLANLISIGQQYLFKIFVDEDEIHHKIQENKKKPASQKKSAFQQRLEEMAKSKGYKLPK